jgi:hypothetical protein
MRVQAQIGRGRVKTGIEKAYPSPNWPGKSENGNREGMSKPVLAGEE